MSSTEKRCFLVERYWPGVNRAELATAEQGMRRAARELTRSGAPIRIVSSTYIPADEVVLTLYEATDEDDVIELNRRCDFAFDRVQRVEVATRMTRRRRT